MSTDPIFWSNMSLGCLKRFEDYLLDEGSIECLPWRHRGLKDQDHFRVRCMLDANFCTEKEKNRWLDYFHYQRDHTENSQWSSMDRNLNLTHTRRKSEKVALWGTSGYPPWWGNETLHWILSKGIAGTHEVMREMICRSQKKRVIEGNPSTETICENLHSYNRN